MQFFEELHGFMNNCTVLPRTVKIGKRGPVQDHPVRSGLVGVKAKETGPDKDPEIEALDLADT
jgi:hypothetical protein